MGLLLMQYEYQKAKQKVNLYELRGIRLNDRQEQYTKRIANIEKLFNKKQSSIESKYSNIQSQLNSKISLMAAAGSFGGFSVASLFGGTILAGAASIAGLDTAFGNAVTGLNDDGKLESQQQLAAARSSLAAQLQSTLQVILQALKDAEIAELEAAEDRQREPIAEKDAEVQADVAENDTLLELAKERMEAAKGRLPDTIKGSVAHYGLS